MAAATRERSEPVDASDSALATVLSFCRSWSSGDPDRICAFLSDAAEWENVPLGIRRGRAEIRQRLVEVFSAAARIDWKVLHAVATLDGHVLTERIDVVDSDGRCVELRLMGIFRVTEGRITLWRDYFDLESYRKALGRSSI